MKLDEGQFEKKEYTRVLRNLILPKLEISDFNEFQDIKI